MGHTKIIEKGHTILSDLYNRFWDTSLIEWTLKMSIVNIFKIECKISLDAIIEF
jgi:hypothetical protein